MKKTIAKILAAAAAAALAAGCGNGVGDANENVNDVLTRFDLTEHAVAFDGEGQSGGRAHEAVFVRAGTVITLPDGGTLVKDGHRFIGWHIGETFYGVGSSYTVTGGVTFYAVWNLNIPGVPADVAASASHNPGQVSVSWASVPWADGYNIYRAEDGGDDYSYLYSPPMAPFTNNDLARGTVYCYMVSARNSAGEGARSAPACAVTAPAAPETVYAEASSSTGITVEWSQVKGAARYNIYRNTLYGEEYGYPYEFIYDTPLTSFTNNGLTPGIVYYYKVSAYNDAGESEWSYPATPPVVTPETPWDVDVVSVSSNSVTISWSSVAGAAEYVVYSSLSYSGYYSYLHTTMNTSFTNNGLSPNTGYCYKVSANNILGESDPSNYICATTAPPVPTVSVASLSSDRVTLSWDWVPGASVYRVYRSVNGSEYMYLYGATNISFTDNGLKAGNEYCYRVTAYSNISGRASEGSAAVCVKPEFF